MYLDKVEMRLAMNQVHRSLVLFFAVAFMDPVPFRGGHGLAELRSLMLYLLQLPINLGQCMLSYSELQEDTIHLVILIEIIFHIRYSVRRVFSVLCHHTEVDERPDGSGSVFERNHL